jgi:hypothetical protein
MVRDEAFRDIYWESNSRSLVGVTERKAKARSKGRKARNFAPAVQV